MTKTYYVSSPDLVNEPDMWYPSEEECYAANSYPGMKITKLTVTVESEPVLPQQVMVADELIRAAEWVKNNPYPRGNQIDTIKAMRADCGAPTLGLAVCKAVTDRCWVGLWGR